MLTVNINQRVDDDEYEITQKCGQIFKKCGLKNEGNEIENDEKL